MEPKDGTIAIWCHSDAMRELQYERDVHEADKYYEPRDREAEEEERRRDRGSKVRPALCRGAGGPQVSDAVIHDHSTDRKASSGL